MSHTTYVLTLAVACVTIAFAGEPSDPQLESLLSFIQQHKSEVLPVWKDFENSLENIPSHNLKDAATPSTTRGADEPLEQGAPASCALRPAPVV